MLKLRIITALVLGPLIIWSVLALPHKYLVIELLAILCLAAWEWARMSGIINQLGRIGFAMFVCGAMMFLTYFLHEYKSLINGLLYFFALFWACALILLFYINRAPIRVIQKITPSEMAVSLLTGLCILLGAFVSIAGLHQNPSYGAKYILVLLLIIWVADSAAYFAGKAFGKRKLAINVSPGKSWEGVIGAVVATVITAYLLTLYLKIDPSKMVAFILVALVTMIFSIVGDLIESLFKRRSGIKDSSQILPGHGGIMDRVDSLVSAAPIFLLGLIGMGIQ